jgi:hypothetical protein
LGCNYGPAQVNTDLNSTIFWNITSSLVDAYRSFGITYCFHLQAGRLSPAVKQQAISRTLLVASLFGLLFDPED